MKLLLPILILLAGCGPSCEERGGTMEFSHMQLTMIPNGRGGFTQIWQPIYQCEIPAQPERSQE